MVHIYIQYIHKIHSSANFITHIPKPDLTVKTYEYLQSCVKHNYSSRYFYVWVKSMTVLNLCILMF